MLDKSIPYKHVLMKRNAGSPAPSPVLPDGYRFVTFRPGDEKSWARLEASVLEFPDAVDAYEYFLENWMTYLPELERRCTFIENPDGEKVATATAWWDYTGERRDPWSIG